jgi:hypothetical protein
MQSHELKAIKAIETNYHGCRFRSRLEARWAVFYDALSIPWVYEPEGFDLGPLGRYLPDFWLPEQKFLIEIKPEEPTREQQEKVCLAAKAMEAEMGFIFFGDIPFPIDHYGSNSQLSTSAVAIWPNCPEGSDIWYAWCICNACGRPGVEFEARSWRLPCHLVEEGGRGHNGDHPRLLKAYREARSARF